MVQVETHHKIKEEVSTDSQLCQAPWDLSQFLKRVCDWEEVNMSEIETEQSLQDAIRFIEEKFRPESPLADPRQDPRWLIMCQLHQVQLDNLREAELDEFKASEAVWLARKLEEEVRRRLELLEIDLGIDEKAEAI